MKKPSKLISLLLAAVMFFSASCVSIMASAAVPTAAQDSVETLIQNKNLAELTGWLITNLNYDKTNVTGTALRLLYEFAGDNIGGEGKDTFHMTDEQLARTLLDWLDAILPEWMSDVTAQSSWNTVTSVANLLGVTLNLSSVDGVIDTVRSFCDKVNNDAIVGGVVGDLKNLNGAALKGVKRSGGNLNVLYAVLQWINDNQSLVKKFIVGGFSNDGVKLGSILYDRIGVMLNEINNSVKNLPDFLKGMLYRLLDQHAEAPSISNNPKGGWGASPYASYSADELLASALIIALSGNTKQSADDPLNVVPRAEANAALNLSGYGLLAKYGKAFLNRFAETMLNGALKEQIAELKGNEAAKEFFNFDYLFTDSTFDAAFKDAETSGILGQLNNILYTCMKTMLTPDAFKAVAPVKGGNENLNENLAKLCRNVLPVLAGSSSELGVDLSKFTADAVKDMDLAEMAAAVLKIFFPVWFKDSYAKEPNLLRNAKTLAQLCAVAMKYLAGTPALEAGLSDGFNAADAVKGITADGIAAMSDRECTELSMAAAVKLAACAFDGKKDQTHFMPADGWKNWTWRETLDEIVDWALNYVKGIPAVAAKDLTTKSGEYDGYGPFYKINVVLNELFDFSFLNNVNDETFRLDTETLLFDALLGNLFNGDFAAIVNVFEKNVNENNLFNTPISKGVIGAVDRALSALFSHTCGASAGFEKELSCTEALTGSYDTKNGHYVGTPIAKAIDAHNFAEAPDKSVAPTCGKDGYTVYECAKCGETRQETLPATGEHDYQETGLQTLDDGTVVVTFTCSVCGDETTETEEYLKGDVDGDGKVTAADARLTLRAAVGLEQFEAGSAPFRGADCTGDGEIKPADARLILRRCVGLVSDSFEESTGLPKPSSPSVSFSVGEYADGKATVVASLVDCVGLTSGYLTFSYPDGTITKIIKKNGTDAKNIGDVDNYFASECNSGSNPARFGFYFKDYLWDSATWAAAEGADQAVNGERFEMAQFTCTGSSLYLVVTGELCFGNTVVPVQQTIGTPPRDPGDVDGDGEITSGDARLTLRAALGLETFAADSAQYLAADCTGDGVIKPADARLILRRSVGLISDSFEESTGLPKPSSPSVRFSVGENVDGKATISASLVDCVGLTSGSLSFSYPDGTVTKITKKNGTDAKNIGDVDNAFCSEFNSGSNPAAFGFYFKDYLWDSATWAKADNAEPEYTVNGENFEFAKFTFTADRSAYVIITGELCFGDTVVPVNQTIGTPPRDPGDVDGDGEITSADARLALRASVELESFHPSTSAFRSADFDNDGTITSADARKILRAAVRLSTDDSELTNVPTPSSPSVSFSVGEYADGRATVSASFADCVGLTSGYLTFSYPDGTVTKIVKKNGTDAKNIGDVDNGFSSEFNSGSNPAKFGFYFKNYLWDSAAWAADGDAYGSVNGERFEFAQYVFTAERGTAVSVTGELRFGTTTVTVSDSFLIGWQDASVVFDVGEYDAAAGKVTVSASFVNCVGLTSCPLSFSYPKGTVTKVTIKNGVDVKNIGDRNNAFSSEFNASANPMQFLGYFKDTLWNSAAWAADENADAPVNGENFEFASFTFTADPGTVITVTGELRFGSVTVPVSTSFVLGSSVTETTTQIPKPTEPTTEPKTERPVPETPTHSSYRPLNENGPVAFTLTRFEGTDAVISASFIDCVGIESGQLTFTSSNNTLRYVGCNAGADAGKVSKSENKFIYDINDSTSDRIVYGFYFQENLWDSAAWATAKGVDGKVNSERFAFASFQFTLTPGTVVTVTGKLKDINGNERTVNESFQIGETPAPEVPTQADNGLVDSFGNKILGYDKYGQAIIGAKDGQFIYSPDPNAHTHSHIFSGVTVIPASCTEPGEGAWTCDICGFVSNTYTIDPTGHNPDNGRVTKPATCKEEGVMTYTCYLCGQVVRTETIPKPKEHQWDIGKVTKAATASAGGEMLYTCKLCGDTRTEKTPKLAVAETGSCGEKVTYTLWNSGLLEIAGSGPMTDYAYGDAPWFKKDTVRDVKIGKGVTTVPEGAFSQCKNLQSVTVPEGVTEIVYAAFSLCPGLETVELPKTVKTIGENAFYGCDGLQKIALPDNVKTIGDYAFMNCDELTEVGLPKKLETVGRGAFAYSGKLAALTPPAGVTDVGYNAFYRTAWYTAQPEGIVYFGKVLYKYKGTPQPVSGKIPSDYEAGVMPENTELTVKAGTVRIADYAFQNCGGLVGLTLPDGLLSIGRYALYSCRNLAKVNFPDSIASIGDDALPYYLNWPWFQSQPDGMVYVGKIAYRYKGEMKPGAALTLKDGTTQIYSEAFYEQTNLKKITIPESVTQIGYHAFTRCSSLESVRVPKAVTVIQSNTFAGCANLREAVLPEGLKTIEYYAFQGCEKLERIALPDSLTAIMSGAFRDCAALKEITIPKNVTTFSDSAFADCSALERGAVHADNPVYYSEGDCVIEKETKAVVLGGSASVLPDGVNAIVYNAFSGRKNLKEITIPSSLKSLNGFSGCTGLTAITIPDGVTEIGRYAFSDCTGLTGELVIPDSVTSLGYEAFCRCTGLTGVRLSDNLTAIKDNAFSRCSGLTSVAIPAKVERIGYAAFGYCDGLREVKIPGNVKTIEWDAFEYCRNLASVTVESGVETIGGYAFYGCDSLAGICIPASVTFIGDNAIPAHTVIYGKPGSYAETWAKENNRAFVVLDEAYLTMYTAPVVNVPTAEAYGFATPGAQVKLTLNGKKAATVTAAGSGRWSAALPLKGAKDGGSFTLKASVTFNKKTVSAEETVIYRPNAVVFKEFELRHSYYSATVNEENLSVTVPNFTIVPGYPFAFRVAVSNSDRIEKLWVVSTENGVSKKMALTYNEVTGQWFSGEGFFADTDRYYVPGVFTVEGVDKDGKAFDCGVTIRFRFLIDPSGYVYEAVQSNRIEGATVSVYYKDEEGRELLWNAAEAGQTNPITTLADGAFAWDVPKGQWQVQVTKSGYETVKSDWMDVPPEWKNVFIALVSSEYPTVKALNVYKDHADILFSAYMDIDSVNTDTVVFEGYTGKIAPVGKTETAEKSGVFYATAFRFTPDKPFTGEVKVKLQAAPVKEETGSGKAASDKAASVKPAKPQKTDGGSEEEQSPWTKTSGYSGIQNYAGKPLYACEGTFQVTAEPKNLSVEKTMSVVYGQTAEIVVSAENATGKTVAIFCDSANVALSAKTLTLDQDGKASLTVTGEMPGTVKLTFTLEGTALTAEAEATVELPEPETPDVMMGDVDGDGELTSGDARLALRASVKLETYEEGSAAYIAADVDRNGSIESSDARLILRASVKLEDPTKW